MDVAPSIIRKKFPEMSGTRTEETFIGGKLATCRKLFVELETIDDSLIKVSKTNFMVRVDASNFCIEMKKTSVIECQNIASRLCKVGLIGISVQFRPDTELMLLVLRHIQRYFSYVATGYSYPLSGHPIRC